MLGWAVLFESGLNQSRTNMNFDYDLGFSTSRNILLGVISLAVKLAEESAL